MQSWVLSKSSWCVNCLNSKQPSFGLFPVAGICEVTSHWHTSGSFAKGVSKSFFFHASKHHTFCMATWFTYCLPEKKIQCWEGSLAVLRFCPFSPLQVYLFTFKSAKGEKFLIPQLSICPLKTHCFCYQIKPNSCSLTFFFLCRAAFFSRKSITVDN